MRVRKAYFTSKSASFRLPVSEFCYSPTWCFGAVCVYFMLGSLFLYAGGLLFSQHEGSLSRCFVAPHFQMLSCILYTCKKRVGMHSWCSMASQHRQANRQSVLAAGPPPCSVAKQEPRSHNLTTNTLRKGTCNTELRTTTSTTSASAVTGHSRNGTTTPSLPPPEQPPPRPWAGRLLLRLPTTSCFRYAHSWYYSQCYCCWWSCCHYYDDDCHYSEYYRLLLLPPLR